MAAPKRITLVADELLGYGRAGGLGTATSFLAVALGRQGHEVEVLYIAETAEGPPAAEWARLYDEAGIGVRPLARSGERTEPPSFARARDVERSLRANPADVVITQDLAAPTYTALRLRRLGLGFERTLFIVYCHGTRQWITDVARKPRVLPGALAVSVLERASVELADVVVSPSAYLLEWMRNERWHLPQRSLVIPYLTRSVATGEPATRVRARGPTRRIAFFGRLEERKGLVPFTAGVNTLDGDLLRGVRLEFVGRPTPAWPPERVAALISDETRQSVDAVSFQTELDQAEALARLAEPGTLAVIPSLEDNSPNAVYECLERRIPFVASTGGGTAELVAPEDRDRVLFDPTAQGVADALSRALGAEDFAPAEFAFDPEAALQDWDDVLAQTPLPHTHATRPVVDVAIERRGRERLAAGDSDWVVFLEDADVPDDQLVETLARAQSASGADIVSCGVRSQSNLHHYFLGDAGALGTLSNTYGTVALIRRSLLTTQTSQAGGAQDADWPLLARLVLLGAKLVSVPETLVTTERRPGDVRHDPAGALTVVQEFERRLPETSHGLARLAAGLAAQVAAPPSPARRSRVGRLSRLLPGR
jgi:glycosyltransferase involved in cell wall biosynthesis